MSPKTPYTLLFPVDVTFKSPVNGDRTETVKSVQVRRLIGADLLEADNPSNGEMRLLTILVANTTGLETPIVAKLDAADLFGIDVIMSGGSLANAAIIDAALANSASTVAVPLIVPVDDLTEVRLRRLCGADLIEMDKTPMQPARTMLSNIARSASLDFDVVKTLDAADIHTMDAILQGFTKPGRPAGEISAAT